MQKIGFCEHYMLTTDVLNRTKELTRRVEKALERAVADYEKQHGEPFEIITQYWDEKRKKVCCLTKHGIIHVGTHYQRNEVVALAQAYNDFYNDECDPRQFPEGNGWTNKMFVKPSLMPHQIQITDINIERLQDISDEDCLKEGVYYDADVDGYKVANLSMPNKGFRGDLFRQKYFFTPREAFASLINKRGVGRPGLWESNPWVVVYQFKLVK